MPAELKKISLIIIAMHALLYSSNLNMHGPWLSTDGLQYFSLLFNESTNIQALGKASP